MAAISMRPNFMRLAVVRGFFAVAVLCAWSISASASIKEAGNFLIELNREAVSQLNDPNTGNDQKVETFLDMIERTFDVVKIGKFVLGRNWRRTSPEQREAFIEVFARVNIQRFLPLFTKYADQRFDVTKVRQDDSNPRLYFVTSTVTRGEGPPAVVEWRTLKDDKRYRILDVKAEGVSMALTLRNEYSSVVRSEGVDGLIELLRSKVIDNDTLLSQ